MTDGTDDAWFDRRARRQRWIAWLVVLALALPSTAALWSFAS
ncbi:MAG: hypothetical protein ACR2FV_02960 [Ornithinimicrobium sp.]